MYEFKSRVRYSEVNSEKVLTLAALTDYLQDTCTFQSEELGAGMDFLKGEKGSMDFIFLGDCNKGYAEGLPGDFSWNISMLVQGILRTS